MASLFSSYEAPIHEKERVAEGLPHLSYSTPHCLYEGYGVPDSGFKST